MADETSGKNDRTPSSNRDTPPVDRGVFRELAPVIVGAVLGGLLTALPTLWVTQSQLRTQVQLAREAQQEQARQRRLQAAKTLLTTCVDTAMLGQRLALAMPNPSQFRDLFAEWQHAQARELIAYLQVAGEFPGAVGSLPRLPMSLELDTSKDPTPRDEIKQRALSLAQKYSSNCRSTTESLMRMLTADLGTRKDEEPNKGMSRRADARGSCLALI